MSQDEERIALLRRLYDAFNRRDIDAVLPMLTPDVDWPNMMERTRAIGHDEVREYWEYQFTQVSPTVEPVAFEIDEDRVLVAVHQVIRALDGSIRSNTHIAHAYAFEGPLIASMHVYLNMDEAWAGED
ncbi:MAG: nuclear transport factor 2 family protein [Dehalococcoidia bacterium]|nr:MAG: nuclear transport factor 2 family protein [Dehalococcoidia bacterium]